jgi:hypothetical protein
MRGSGDLVDLGLSGPFADRMEQMLFQYGDS